MTSFTPFRPDLGELKSGTVLNVSMSAGGYGPSKLLAAAPGAAAFTGTTPRGHITAVLPDGTFKAFVASVSEVYEMTSAFAWSALTAGLAVPDGNDEVMEQFGVYLIATNTVDGMDAYNMETPAGWNAISGAPVARGVFKSNNMLIAWDCDGNNRRYRTSAFGDFTNWLTAGATAADLPDGEALTGGWDLSNGAAILFQKNAVRRLSWGHAGGGALFRQDKLADSVGAVHPRSVIGRNGRVYFVHENGFRATDGASVQDIGSEKVNRWFIENCADLTTVHAAIDQRNTLVRFRYKSVNCSSDTIYDDYLDYNWNTEEFIPGSQRTMAILRMSTPGYTLDGLDALGTLDALTFSLDSVFYRGNTPQLTGLDADGKFGAFDGANAAAVLETPTLMGPASVLISSTTPITDDPAATVQLGVKDMLSSNVTWKTAVAIQASGRVPVRGRGKLQRYRVNHAAGAVWTNTQGIEPDQAANGGPR